MKFTFQRDHQYRGRSANAGCGQKHEKRNPGNDPGVMNFGVGAFQPVIPFAVQPATKCLE